MGPSPINKKAGVSEYPSIGAERTPKGIGIDARCFGGPLVSDPLV